MRYTNYRFDVPEEKIVRVIVDTDAKNEADDQFAIVQALLSPKFENVGFIAAHFGTDRFVDSMERSYQELCTIFDKMHMDKSVIFKGAPHGLVTKSEPVVSEGRRIIWGLKLWRLMWYFPAALSCGRGRKMAMR